MPVEIGSRLGHYDVTALIGEGGMGQVYQATDTKLNRQVALKILPEAFAGDPDRLARFQREAQVLASLNHPNIATIHGLEDSEGTKALVLELVEGPTLADRIAQGPIPIDEALPIAKQIAEALEAAHEAGVIHRDLKPANIKVRDDGTVKVLDFGLAKAFETEAPDISGSMSPTISLTAAATQMGMVIGTAAYMAPEQAKGLPVDKRADIWAFGAVLFEMLTGKKLFDAGDVSEMLASVLVKDPDISSMGTQVPANIQSVVRRCLVKDPKQRLRDIGDVRLAMTETFETTVSIPTTEAVAQPAGWLQALPWVAGILLAVVTGLAIWSLTRPDTPRVVRFTVAHDEVSRLYVGFQSRDISISPDGEYVAYLTGPAGNGAEQLRLRPLGQLTSETLATGGGFNLPFFSPDSQSVGFYEFGAGSAFLKRVAVRGGPTSTICELPDGVRGASWGADGTIIFATPVPDSGLWEVSAVGGEPRQLTTPDAEGNHEWPEILPGGDAVLFTISTGSNDEAQIAVLSLDTLEYEVVVSGGTFPQYSPTGHLLYVVQGNMWAVGFDLNGLKTVGDPVPVQEGVMTKIPGGANFSVSANGSLVFMTGEAGSGFARLNSLVWVDRDGNEELVAATPGIFSVQLSPDDQQAVTQGQLGGNTNAATNLEVYDLARDTPRLFTSNGENQYPIWTPDGERIVWQLDDNNIVWQAADGTGQVEHLTTSENFQAPFSWSADGQKLVMIEARPETGSDIGTLSIDGDPTIDWLLQSDSNELYPDVSPDGRWMAYTTSESGQREVFATPFPSLDGRWKISQDGGATPQWGPDSRELFFQTPDGTIMVAEIVTEPTFDYEVPVPVFGEPYWIGGNPPARAFDISSDGQRLLVIKQGAPTDATVEINVVLNWTEELTRLVPVD